MLLKKALLAALLLLATNTFANDRYPFDNEVDAQRFQSLSYQVQCLVCQGQSIGDSDSYFAVNMREWLFDAINDGYSDIEIRLQLVERFGEKIFYKPGFNANSALLWLSPALFILFGLIYFIRRGRHVAS